MLELVISLITPDLNDAERSADLLLRLREEIRELPIEKIENKRSGSAPEGARSAEAAVSWTALLVTLGKPALTSLFHLIQSWIARQTMPTKVTISLGKTKIIIEGNATTEQQAIIDKFLATAQSVPNESVMLKKKSPK